MERRKAVRLVTSTKNSESGTQLVEFALVAPVFTLILFAFAQYGLLFSSYLAVRNASTVGGRQAIISPGNTNAIISVATAAAGAMLVDTNHVHVDVGTVTLSTGAIGTSVKVSYPLKLIVPFVVPPFTNTGRTRTVTALTIVQ